MGLSITLKAGRGMLRWQWGAIAQWSEHLQLKQKALGLIPDGCPGFFSLAAGLYQEYIKRGKRVSNAIYTALDVYGESRAWNVYIDQSEHTGSVPHYSLLGAITLVFAGGVSISCTSFSFAANASTSIRRSIYFIHIRTCLITCTLPEVTLPSAYI